MIAEAMVANEAGQMVQTWWTELASKFPSVALDEFVVMPNHVHGVIRISEHANVPPVSLVRLVAWYKTMTTNAYIRGVKANSWKRFSGTLWQRSFYDHVVRNEEDLNRIRQYILDNPARWAEDQENPERA